MNIKSNKFKLIIGSSILVLFIVMGLFIKAKSSDKKVQPKKISKNDTKPKKKDFLWDYNDYFLDKKPGLDKYKKSEVGVNKKNVIVMYYFDKKLANGPKDSSKQYWQKFLNGDRLATKNGRWAVGLTTFKETGDTYYFDDEGLTYIGWLKDKSGWSYFGKDGKRVSGWLKYNGRFYHLNDKGYMDVGDKVIGGTTFTFSKDGILMSDEDKKIKKRLNGVKFLEVNEKDTFFKKYTNPSLKDYAPNTRVYNNSTGTLMVKFDDDTRMSYSNGRWMIGAVDLPIEGIPHAVSNQQTFRLEIFIERVLGTYKFDLAGFMVSGWDKVLEKNNRKIYYNEDGRRAVGKTIIEGKEYDFPYRRYYTLRRNVIEGKNNVITDPGASPEPIKKNNPKGAVLLIENDGNYQALGTYISENVVVTAAQNVYNKRTKKKAKRVEVYGSAIIDRNLIYSKYGRRVVVDWKIPKGYFSDDEQESMNNNIAFLILDEPVGTKFENPLIEPKNTKVLKGVDLKIDTFGLNDIMSKSSIKVESEIDTMFRFSGDGQTLGDYRGGGKIEDSKGNIVGIHTVNSKNKKSYAVKINKQIYDMAKEVIASTR